MHHNSEETGTYFSISLSRRSWIRLLNQNRKVLFIHHTIYSIHHKQGIISGVTPWNLFIYKPIWWLIWVIKAFLGDTSLTKSIAFPQAEMRNVLFLSQCINYKIFLTHKVSPYLFRGHNLNLLYTQNFRFWNHKQANGNGTLWLAISPFSLY